MSTYISYAQNFEDVMLRRALQDVDQGFYVDVGAHHPLKDSVTRAFYERGWRGINIEPVRAWLDLLEIDRPEDINLGVAIGLARGHVDFYDVDDTGLSTTNPEIASQHAGDGFLVRMIRVEATTLDDVLEQHARADIHFLKIDVEGAEGDVLGGLSLDRWRPWIVVVESTRPNTQDDIRGAWEGALIEAGYTMTYFDGLNRFYLAKERSELARHFSCPPNFFDDFVRHSDWERGEEARRLREELEVLQRGTDEAVGQLEAQVSAQSDLIETQRECIDTQRERIVAQEERIDAQVQHVLELKAAIEQVKREHSEETAKIQFLHDASLAEEAARFEVRETLALERLGAEHEAQLRRLARRLEEIERLRHLHRHQLRLLTESRSWRLTRPLRWIAEKMGASRPFPVTDDVPNVVESPLIGELESRAGPAVPDTETLLRLASRAEASPRQTPSIVSAPAHVPAMVQSELHEVLNQLEAFSAIPTGLPPRLDSIPGSSLLKGPILRVYERLFRKQALINRKVLEALRLLKDSSRDH